MSTYVDTSTLLKLLIDEPGTDRATQIWEAASPVVSIRLLEVEARAALAAAVRAHRLTPDEHRGAKASLASLLGQVDVVEVTRDLVAAASDLAEQEGLCGYDAVHLAAALLVEADILTSADTALCLAASRQGLAVADPLATA